MPFAGSEYIGGCAERDDLVDRLAQATTHYARAVADFTVRRGTIGATAYSIAKASVEMARQDAEAARGSLLEHRREHGCG
jgi:hypothetical protein